MRKKRSAGKKGLLQRPLPLNALALGVALSGFFIPLFTQSFSGLADGARTMAAASDASLTAAVPENPINSLAAQLNAKEQELNAREAALNARAAAPQYSSLGGMFGFISFALSLILCGLVALNFYLDSRRGKRRGAVAGGYSVDLS